MSLRFTCDCGQVLRVNDHLLRSHYKCRRCGAKLQIPTTAPSQTPLRKDVPLPPNPVMQTMLSSERGEVPSGTVPAGRADSALGNWPSPSLDHVTTAWQRIGIGSGILLMASVLGVAIFLAMGKPSTAPSNPSKDQNVAAADTVVENNGINAPIPDTGKPNEATELVVEKAAFNQRNPDADELAEAADPAVEKIGIDVPNPDPRELEGLAQASEYYDLAELLSEDHWKEGVQPVHLSVDKVLDRFNLLRKSQSRLVREVAEQGLISFATWQSWKKLLAGQGLTYKDLQAAQKEWAFSLAKMEIKGINPEAFGGELEITQSAIKDLSNITQMFVEKFKVDDFRRHRNADYRETNYKIWQNQLLAIAPTFAGPVSPTPALLLYQSYSQDPYSSATIPYVIVKNVSGRDLTNCTLDVLLEPDGKPPTDHRVYFFDTLKNQHSLVLQQNLLKGSWILGDTALLGAGPPLHITYSVWTNELQEVNQMLLAVCSTFTRIQKPEKTVQRVSRDDLLRLTAERESLLNALERKVYVPKFQKRKELFRGSIHFEGITETPWETGITITSLKLSLEDRRWQVWPNEARICWNPDPGYFVKFSMTGPGAAGFNAMQTQSRFLNCKVFIRDGSVYLEPVFVESNSRVNNKGVLEYDNREELGPVVPLHLQ